MIARFVRSKAARPALAAGVAMALFAAGPSLRAGDALDKSLFLSVLDPSGAPIKDLALGDILIREDGTDREVIAVKPSSQPISVAMLVDTAQGTRVADAYGTVEQYTTDIRNSAAIFGKTLLSKSPDAAISLMEFGQAAIPIVRFTKNLEEYQKGVNKIFPKADVPSVLKEAIVQANKDLASQPSPRRAIVTLNFEPSDEQSHEDTKSIVNSFKESGAQLWSVSVQRGALKNAKRDVSLDQFTKNSGGKRDFIVGISTVPEILQKYADALTYQYEVVFKRPEGKKPPEQIQVGLARQGKYEIHASGFAPK
jgi:hypothetical protein